MVNTFPSSSDSGFDVAIIGGGIAGASLAYELSSTCRVLLLEAESQPGYHTTGRSAALFCASYGNAVIRRLTAASRAFLWQPPAGFADVPLLSPRGTLMIGRADQMERVRAHAAAVRAHASGVREVDGKFALGLVPALRPEAVAGAVYEADAMDIDVHALHHGYLRGARSRGAVVQYGVVVEHLERQDQRWHIAGRQANWQAACIVNAAGAWADAVAAMAGAAPLGLAALRRTAVTVAPPTGMDIRHWPAVIDIDEQFYFKPESGKLLLSPADETPSPACDAQPEDLDIAIGVDRVQAALDLEVTRIDHAWAGLRTFAPDRTPVVGFDPCVPGFFWLAGQGGYGIQTAPAMAALGADLLRCRLLGGATGAAQRIAENLEPARFTNTVACA